MALYKYTSFLEDFFNTPSIKLSKIKFFNDPFEERIDEDFKSLFEEHYFSERIYNTDGILGKTFRDYPDIFKEFLTDGVCQNIFDESAVISLTTDHTNLLMWAHYADQHKGMVVEFDDEAFSTLDDRNTPPHTVQYKKERFDKERLSSLKNSAQDGKISNSLFEVFITTKSEEWNYENERRAILNLKSFDFLKFKSDSHFQLFKEHFLERFPKWSAHMDKLMTYKEEELIAYVDEINYGFKAKIVKGLESFENDYEKVFLIKKVDPKHVKAVYFGHRVKESEVERIKALISDKNHPLNKINIIHLCIDKKEFILKKRDD